MRVRGSYYHFSQNRLKFSEAEAICKSNNAKLFEPKNAAINTDIAAKAKAKGIKHGPWIGIHDINDENNFVYASNNAIKISWTNWKNGEPNNSGGKEDCVQLSTTNGKWNDNNCNRQLQFVCKISKKKNNYKLYFQLYFLPKQLIKRTIFSGYSL